MYIICYYLFTIVMVVFQLRCDNGDTIHSDSGRNREFNASSPSLSAPLRSRFVNNSNLLSCDPLSHLGYRHQMEYNCDAVDSKN